MNMIRSKKPSRKLTAPIPVRVWPAQKASEAISQVTVQDMAFTNDVREKRLSES